MFVQLSRTFPYKRWHLDNMIESEVMARRVKASLEEAGAEVKVFDLDGPDYFAGSHATTQLAKVYEYSRTNPHMLVGDLVDFLDDEPDRSEERVDGSLA